MCVGGRGGCDGGDEMEKGQQEAVEGDRQGQDSTPPTGAQPSSPGLLSPAESAPLSPDCSLSPQTPTEPDEWLLSGVQTFSQHLFSLCNKPGLQVSGGRA